MTVGTVEHLLATLHAYGITNALIKVQSEVPTMDGSALGFCQLVEQAGVEDQGGSVEEIVIGEPLRVGGTGADEEGISIEPADELQHFVHAGVPPPGRTAGVHLRAPRRRVVQRRDRAGAHLRLRQGHEGDGGDGPGERRPSRQLHPHRRRAAS